MRLLSDSSPEAERVQIELLRKKTPQERFQMMARLTEEVIARSKFAIFRQYPHLSPREVDYNYIRRQYGEELAKDYIIAEQSRHNGRTNNHPPRA